MVNKYINEALYRAKFELINDEEIDFILALLLIISSPYRSVIYYYFFSRYFSGFLSKAILQPLAQK